MNYIELPAANGAIGFAEYSYPLEAGFPVAAVRNSAGYYVLPSEYNVAVALTQARINMNKEPRRKYLLLLLNRVYNYATNKGTARAPATPGAESH